MLERHITSTPQDLLAEQHTCGTERTEAAWRSSSSMRACRAFALASARSARC